MATKAVTKKPADQKPPPEAKPPKEPTNKDILQLQREKEEKGLAASEKRFKWICIDQETADAVIPCFPTQINNQSWERFKKMAWHHFRTSAMQNRMLWRCTRASLVEALKDAAGAGLIPGINGEGYFVTFGPTCMFMMGYRGMLKLASATDGIENPQAVKVHEFDQWTYEEGSQPFIHHVPAALVPPPDTPKEIADRWPGELIGVYCRVHIHGRENLTVMRRSDIEKIKEGVRVKNQGKNSKRYEFRPDAPWVAYFEEMALKSVVRKAWKGWPVTTNVSVAFASDMKNDGSDLFTPADAPTFQLPTRTPDTLENMGGPAHAEPDAE